MLNVFISIRANGNNYEELLSRQNRIFNDFLKFKPKYADLTTKIDSLIPSYKIGESNRIEFLGKSITSMKDADIVLVPIDYIKSKGCKCERYIAEIYELPIYTYIELPDCTYFVDGFIDMIDTDAVYMRG